MRDRTGTVGCVADAPDGADNAFVFVFAFDENYRMHLQGKILSSYHSPRTEPDQIAHAALPRPRHAQRGRVPGWLASRGAEVVRAMGDAAAAQLAEYGEVIGAQPACGLIAEMFEPLIESAVTGEPYADRELDRFRELGARAAHWGLPLLDLTTMFNVALAAAHREFWSMAPPVDFVEIAQITARCASMAELARDACVDAFVGPRAEGADTRLARKLLAERLIAGSDDGDPGWLRALDHDVAPGYLVLACESGADGSVWTRVEEDLARLRGVLYVGDHSMATILFPADGEDDAVRAANGAADLVERISQLAGGTVYATQAYRPGLADLPATVAEARRLLPLVKAIPDAQVKPYRTDELLVELALVQQSAIRRRLAGLISPLDAGTGLRRTLEVLLACNLDRERAATELCIHRRTLYYRMDRIRKLSGIDPNTAHGIQLLRSALTSARMEEMAGLAPPEPDDAALAVSVTMTEAKVEALSAPDRLPGLAEH